MVTQRLVERGETERVQKLPSTRYYRLRWHHMTTDPHLSSAMLEWGAASGSCSPRPGTSQYLFFLADLATIET